MKTIWKVGALVSFVLFVACSSAPKCETPEEVTYNLVVAPLVEEKCYMCHAPEKYKAKGGRVKLHEYASLKKLGEKGNLMGAVNHEKGYTAMPYKKEVKIDTCARLVLQAWVDGGFKE